MAVHPVPGPVPTFSLAERERRWALARRFMAEHRLDALLVFSEHEDGGPAPFCMDTWFTNERSGMTVIVPPEGEPTVFAPVMTYVWDHLEGGRRGDGGWIKAESFRLGNRSPELAAELDAMGLRSGRVGVFGLEPYPPVYPEGIVPYGLWKNILDRFPGVEFVPVGLAFARLMMPLSEEEVAVVSHSAAIGDAMARAMVETARPGVSEADIYAAAVAAGHRSGSTAPAMHFWTGPAPTASGPPQWGYRPQAPRIIEDGDFIATEVFSNFGMHMTQHQVAIAVGKVHDEIERAAEIASASYDAGLDAMRAGKTFGEVGEAMLAPVETAGGWVRGPQIHGLNPYGAFCRIPGGRGQVPGVENYPDFAGMTPPLQDMELEPGMSFAFEPSCGLGRYLVTVGGTVIVGENGPIELNAYSSRLLRAQG